MNRDIHGRVIDFVVKDKWISYIKNKYKNDVYYKKLKKSDRLAIDTVTDILSKEIDTSNYNIENSYLYLKTLISKAYFKAEDVLLNRYKNKINKTFKSIKELMNE